MNHPFRFTKIYEHLVLGRVLCGYCKHASQEISTRTYSHSNANGSAI